MFLGGERDLPSRLSDTSISVERLDREIQIRRSRQDGLDHQLFSVSVKVSLKYFNMNMLLRLYYVRLAKSNSKPSESIVDSFN